MMNCADFHLLGLQASWNQREETGEFEEGKRRERKKGETETERGRDS